MLSLRAEREAHSKGSSERRWDRVRPPTSGPLAQGGGFSSDDNASCRGQRLQRGAQGCRVTRLSGTRLRASSPSSIPARHSTAFAQSHLAPGMALGASIRRHPGNCSYSDKGHQHVEFPLQEDLHFGFRTNQPSRLYRNYQTPSVSFATSSG